MNYEFTLDELREVIKAARVFCPSFAESQYQHLMTLGKRVADSGYLEAVHALARLEKEKGIPCTGALDACKQLLLDKEQLEGELAGFKQELAAQQNANREAEHRFRQFRRGEERAGEAQSYHCRRGEELGGESKATRWISSITSV